MKQEKILSEMEMLFMALADKTRLRLLNLLREGEICVCYFTEVLNESQPKISRHLAYLRNAGIVSTRRDGKWIHYSIAMPSNIFIQRIFQETLDSLAAQEDMIKDVRKLKYACTGENVPDSVAHAPIPEAFAETNSNNYREEELETYLL